MAVLLLLSTALLSTLAWANDWSSGYRSRSTEESGLSEWLGHRYGESRLRLDLNGSWQARRNGEQSWHTVTAPGVYDFEGTVEFRRSFRLDSAFVGRTLKLVAFGINNRCTFFVNDDFVGGHQGGHTSFEIEIEPESIRFGDENVLRVLVDNRLRARRSLPLKHRPGLLFNYGGIFRDMFLLGVSPVRLGQVEVRKTFEDGYRICRLQISAFVTNLPLNKFEQDTASVILTCQLQDTLTNRVVGDFRSQRLEVPQGQVRQDVSFELMDPELWSPERPFAYELRLMLYDGDQIIDALTVSLGLAEFTTRGRKFILNGQPFRLRGLDWYEETYENGPTFGRQTLREELQKIKDLGANTVRVVGIPPHPFVLDLCDELGLLIFQEMPLTAVPASVLEDGKFSELAEKYFTEMLNRDGLHVSLAAWGFGRDLDFTEPVTHQFVDRLRQMAAGSQRLTYTVFRNQKRRTKTGSLDFVILQRFDKPVDNDFLGFFGRYLPEKPVLVSLGFPALPEADGLSANHSELSQIDAFPQVPKQVEIEELQAHQLQQAIARVKNVNDSTGFFVHTYADWRAAQPNLRNGYQRDLINRSGLVTAQRKKRLVRDVVEAEFKQGRAIQVPERSIEKVNPNIYPISGIALVLVFLFNFNRSRRLRDTLKRIFKYPHGFFMELRENRKIPFSHTIFLSFVVCAVISMITSSILFRLRNSAVFSDFLDLILESNTLKMELGWLTWHPLYFMGVLFLILYVGFVLLALLLKVVSYFLDQSLPMGQFFTQVFCVFANVVWLLPVVPIYYRLISRPGWVLPATALLSLFLLWSAVRLFRSIRVVYNLNLGKTLFLVVVLMVVFLGGAGWYYNNTSALLEYLPLYWRFLVG